MSIFGFLTKGVVGKVISVAGAGIGSAVAADMAHKAGLVDNLALFGLDLLGVPVRSSPVLPALGAARQPSDPPPPSGEDESSPAHASTPPAPNPEPEAPLNVGHAEHGHGECNCAKNPNKEHRCGKCKEAAAAVVGSSPNVAGGVTPNGMDGKMTYSPPCGQPPDKNWEAYHNAYGFKEKEYQRDYNAWLACHNQEQAQQAAATAQYNAQVQQQKDAKAAAQKTLASTAAYYQKQLDAAKLKAAQAETEAARQAAATQAANLQAQLTAAQQTQQALATQSTPQTSAFESAILQAAAQNPFNLFGLFQRMAPQAPPPPPMPMAPPPPAYPTQFPWGAPVAPQIMPAPMMAPGAPAMMPGADMSPVQSVLFDDASWQTGDPSFDQLAAWSVSGVEDRIEYGFEVAGIAQDYMSIMNGLGIDELSDDAGGIAPACQVCTGIGPNLEG